MINMGLKMKLRGTRWFYAALCFSLLAACSHEAPPTPPATTQRLVTLAPNLTEMVFSAGAGAQLVGVVEYSDYPEAAKSIQRIGDAFRLDEERLLALRPDVVLAWNTGTPQAVIQRLRALGLRVVELDTNRLAQLAQSIRDIGALAGTSSTADASAAAFEQRLAALREGHGSSAPLKVFVEVDRDPLFTINGQHLINEVIELCGGRNVFAALSNVAAAVSVEAVIEANPQMIVASGSDEAALKAEWAKWSAIDAVRHGQLHVIDGDLLSRGGPRIVDAAQAMCENLDSARVALSQSEK